jgi:hypothetical protein
MYIDRKISLRIVRRLFLIFLFTLTIHTIYSQENQSTDGKWIISFNCSANKTFRTAGKMNSTYRAKYGPSYHYINYQVPKYGWHTSVLIARKIFKSLYFQTGVIIDNQGYKTTTISDTFYTNHGTIAEIEKYNIKYNFRCIGLPLRIPLYRPPVKNY